MQNRKLVRRCPFPLFDQSLTWHSFAATAQFGGKFTKLEAIAAVPGDSNFFLNKKNIMTYISQTYISLHNQSYICFNFVLHILQSSDVVSLYSLIKRERYKVVFKHDKSWPENELLLYCVWRGDKESKRAPYEVPTSVAYPQRRAILGHEAAREREKGGIELDETE